MQTASEHCKNDLVSGSNACKTYASLPAINQLGETSDPADQQTIARDNGLRSL